MSGDERAVVALTLQHPQSLHDVEKWADLALGLGFPSDSPVEASYGTVVVRAYLAQATVPEDASDE